MTIKFNDEGKRSRAEALEDPGATLNGIKLVFVTLAPSASPPHALLDVEFCNTNGLNDILTDIQNNVFLPTDIFPITGGSRLPAGTEPHQVQVTEAAAGSSPRMLRLTVAPGIGRGTRATLLATPPSSAPGSAAHSRSPDVTAPLP